MPNTDLIVNVWTGEREAIRGHLRFREKELVIVSEADKVIANRDQTSVLYTLVDDSRMSGLKIQFRPILTTTHNYASNVGNISEDIFPPSSGGFYGRLRVGKEKATFIIQRIVNDSRLWLIIGDLKSDEIIETQLIQPYEAEALKLRDDQEIQDSWNHMRWLDQEDNLKEEILSILDEPAPSWKDVSKILTDVSIPDFSLGNTVRETLQQLVPSTFPNSVRDQLMAFLAYLVMDRMKRETLVDPSSQFDVMPLFIVLIRGHFRCIIDNAKWPPYLKLILQSSKGQLEYPKATLHDFGDESWRYLWHKMIEAFPNWFGIANDLARTLNESGKFIPRLPVTRSQAMKSKKAWKERLAGITYGLRFRGHVNPNAIGLTELVYLGAAYRWPHRHMRFITRLGISSDNPPHLQVMNVPPSGVERIMRALPQCIRIAWSNRVVNLGLYNETSDEWDIPIERIIKAANERVSKRRITTRFGTLSSPETYQPTSDEAKVLDLISGVGIPLELFEEPGYFQFWNLNRRQISSSISKMIEKGILHISYDANDARLVSLASIIQGESERVSSMVNSLLTYAPTSTVMLNDGFDSGVVISKFPDDVAYDLASKLNRIGLDEGMAIRCMKPRAFRSYTSTLHQRLLKPDGTWDDDVSAFLSQARSKRRELSESNA